MYCGEAGKSRLRKIGVLARATHDSVAMLHNLDALDPCDDLDTEAARFVRSERRSTIGGILPKWLLPGLH
jgi:hypothetical protein